MNTAIKNYGGFAAILLMLALAFAAVSFVRSYSKSIEPSSFRSFSASGGGKVVAIPDIAQFTFSVLTQGGTDIARLQRENTEKTNGAIAFLKAEGVDSKDIKTQSYNLEPRYQYFSCPPVIQREGQPCPPPEIVGYTITHTVSVKVRDFSKIGGLLSGVVTKGANTVSQVSFTIDDSSQLANEARAQAISKAKETAEAIARAGGFRIGRLLGISEGAIPIPLQTGVLEGRGGAPTPLPAPTIEPGSQEIQVTVTLTYEID